jgi:hypothetical protein
MVRIFVLVCVLALTGCLSLGGGGEPQHTTVIVPQGSTTTCVNQDGTACQPH